MALVKVNWKPSVRELRRFGWVGSGILAALATWRLLGPHSAPGAGRIYEVAGALFLFALVWPRALRPVHLGLSLATFPIGWVVSHILLALLFFGVITPIGLALRLAGRDAMDRSFPGKGSYWARRQRPTDVRSYFKQW